jgi:hypothetical protein
MDPAALLGNGTIFFLQGDPKTQRTVPDRQLRFMRDDRSLGL